MDSLFFYMPDCPIPLLGQELLFKCNVQITFYKNKSQLHIPCQMAWKTQMCLLTEKTLRAPEEDILDVVMNEFLHCGLQRSLVGQRM